MNIEEVTTIQELIDYINQEYRDRQDFGITGVMDNAVKRKMIELLNRTGDASVLFSIDGVNGWHSSFQVDDMYAKVSGNGSIYSTPFRLFPITSSDDQNIVEDGINFLDSLPANYSSSKTLFIDTLTQTLYYYPSPTSGKQEIGVSSVKVVEELPAQGSENTLYLWGNPASLSQSVWIDGQWYTVSAQKETYISRTVAEDDGSEISWPLSDGEVLGVAIDGYDDDRWGQATNIIAGVKYRKGQRIKITYKK